MKRKLLSLLTLSFAYLPAAQAAEITLYDFNEDTAKPAWAAENDGVMGGVSTGSGKIKGGSLIFEGTLSLENNGGFASLQTDDGNWDLSSFKGVKLRVKGDGRTYQFRLATTATYRGSRIDYAASFETKANEWSEVFVPFSEMKPTWRGRKLEGPDLDLENVRQIRLLLGDKKAGPFQLEVDSISTGEK